MFRFLGMAWSFWKLTSKRFGPVGGLVVTAVLLVGYVFFRRLTLRDPSRRETQLRQAT